MDNWNDLRLVLAIARARGLAGAALSLGIDHSTVFRRLNALEGRFCVRLFERLTGGCYEPTPAGALMVTTAERMEDEALALDRAITGRDHRLTGRLRVTSSETLAYRTLTRHLAKFRDEHPGITVELVIENRILSLSRREADIALRPVRPKESDLWGRKLSDVAWTLYGSPAYLASQGGRLCGPAELARHSVIGWEETARGILAADWIGAGVPEAAVVFRTNSLISQLVATRAGIGLALLPCYLGDGDPDLVRALETPLPEMSGELWIVTHEDLKGTARVRAFFDLVGSGLAAERDRFEGRTGGN